MSQQKAVQTAKEPCCGTECCVEPAAEAAVTETTVAESARGEGARPGAGEVKAMVREQYAAIVKAEGSCCGPACCGPGEEVSMSEDYSQVKGYRPEADLGLGCGLPTELAMIRSGDHVLDLGSGAGNDVFVARAQVGEAGHVIGVDMTPEMIAKARANNAKLGFTNVEFRSGEIENLPVDSRTMDVVISNCVLNLVPDKEKAFSEIFRVLKPGGHMSVSDVVLSAPLPARVAGIAALYAGCIGGAEVKSDYLRKISDQGFRGVQVVRERELTLPAAFLAEHLAPEEIRDLAEREVKVLSITYNAQKPNA